MRTIVHMTTVAPVAPSTTDRRARLAVSALFLTNGALFMNLAPRWPEVQASLGLRNATFGLSVAAFPLGAVLAGLAAGALVRRFGSARVAVVGTTGVGVGVLLAGHAPSAPLLAAALLVGGGLDAVTDVAQNAHGLRVQRRYGRSIINSLHALWSIGAVIGGLMATGAVTLGIPLGTHLAVSAVLFALVAVAALRWCLPGRDGEAADGVTATAPEQVQEVASAPRGVGVARRTRWLLAALVLVAMSGTLVEDAGITWAAIYLSGSLGATASVAALGFVALVAAQTVGRLVGDRLVDRFGQRAVARAGGLVAGVGMGLALAFPSVPGTVAGFAAAGLGVATLVPAAMHEADELPGLRPGTGLTVVSWLMRLGFLLSPPVVGAVADAVGLRTGLLVVPVAGMAVVLLAGVLSPRRRTPVPA